MIKSNYVSEIPSLPPQKSKEMGKLITNNAMKEFIDKFVLCIDATLKNILGIWRQLVLCMS